MYNVDLNKYDADGRLELLTGACLVALTRGAPARAQILVY